MRAFRRLTPVVIALLAMFSGACSGEIPTSQATSSSDASIAAPPAAHVDDCVTALPASTEVAATAADDMDHDEPEPAEHEDEPGHVDDHEHDEAEPPHDEDEAPHDDQAEPAHDEDEAVRDDHDVAAAEVDLVIPVEMSDFAYDCRPVIPAGVTVAMQFVNRGAIEHEAVIGDMAAQEEAELAMQAMTADDDHAHEAPSITVGPGETGELIVRFDEPAELILGCHIVGHWDAGMHGDFHVDAAV